MNQSSFFWTLLAAVSMTLYCGTAAMLITKIGRNPPTPTEQQLFRVLITLFVAGVTTILTLLRIWRGSL
jgi:hypothetical protein